MENNGFWKPWRDIILRNFTITTLAYTECYQRLCHYHITQHLPRAWLYYCIYALKTQPPSYSHILEQLRDDTNYYPLTQEEEECKEKKKTYSYWALISLRIYAGNLWVTECYNHLALSLDNFKGVLRGYPSCSKSYG